MKKTGQVKQNKDDEMYEDPRDIIGNNFTIFMYSSA